MALTRLASTCLALAVASALIGCAFGCPKKAAKKLVVKFNPPKYEGCYEDKRSTRDLPGLAGYNPDMSKAMCEQWCRTMKSKYFGLQEGLACWCGEAFGMYGKAEEVLCSMRCVGARNERCGGQLHNSVYKIVD